MTVLEGYPMAQKGLAGRALRLSLYSGVTGGLAIHDGNIGFLLNEPITLTILALSVVAAIAGFRREKQRVADEEVEDQGD